MAGPECMSGGGQQSLPINTGATEQEHGGLALSILGTTETLLQGDEATDETVT